MAKNVLDEIREAAEAGNALILGPGAVHNLQLEIASLQSVSREALSYVREEMADDPTLVREGGGLHELAKALGLVTGG